jgi:hypothetical protein
MFSFYGLDAGACSALFSECGSILCSHDCLEISIWQVSKTGECWSNTLWLAAIMPRARFVLSIKEASSSSLASRPF